MQVPFDIVWKLLKAHAKLARKPVPLLTALSSKAQGQFSAFPPQALASIAWSWGSLGFHPSQQVLDRFWDAASQQLTSFQPRDLAEVVWALGKMHHFPGASAMERTVTLVLQRAEDFSASQLINVLWGCASLGHLGAKVLAAPIMKALDGHNKVRPDHPDMCLLSRT